MSEDREYVTEVGGGFICRYDTSTGYESLHTPDGEEVAMLTEPEDRTFRRDLRRLVEYIATLREALAEARAQAEMLAGSESAAVARQIAADSEALSMAQERDALGQAREGERFRRLAAESQRDRAVGVLWDVFRHLYETFQETPRPDAILAEPFGNVPGHAHEVAGIWDPDNGAKAGTRCEWCAVWERLRALLREVGP